MKECFFHAKVFWNKATADGQNEMREVNKWKPGSGFLNKENLFPPIEEVYSRMGGRHFKHPTMHKPPWNYVTLGLLSYALYPNRYRTSSK